LGLLPRVRLKLRLLLRPLPLNLLGWVLLRLRLLKLLLLLEALHSLRLKLVLLWAPLDRWEVRQQLVLALLLAQ
jgi:hypothetical protein